MAIDPKSLFKQVAASAQGRAEELGERAEVLGEKAEALGARALETGSEFSKRASDALDSGQQKLKEAVYKPVFPEEYAQPDYDRPKMIVIVDEDQRKGVEVCEGAIGWFSKAAGLEVLHLYEEAVPFSGVAFYPRPICDAVYYEDSMTSGRYISLDSYFDVLQQDRNTELKRIAYALGAKKCLLESYESTKTIRMAKGALGGRDKWKSEVKDDKYKARRDSKKGPSKRAEQVVDGQVEGSFEDDVRTERRIVFSQTFEGGASPSRPELKWFAHDQEIQFLIDTRCNGDDANKTTEYHMHLDSSACRTMSVQLAAKLDKAIGKLGAICNFSLQGEALSESRKTFQFDVEF